VSEHPIGPGIIAARIAREIGTFAANLLGCVIMFCLAWLAVHVPLSEPRGEAVENLLFLCLDYLPLAFTILYLPLRLLGTLKKDWPRAARRVLLSPWALGISLGLPLALGETYAGVFGLLTPVVRILRP
jgi:hypothetical protein